MKFEYALIGVMGFLIGGILVLIAVDPGETQQQEIEPAKEMTFDFKKFFSIINFNGLDQTRTIY